MSLEVEEVARREAELMENPGEIPVRVRVRWEGGLCLPNEEGEKEEKANNELNSRRKQSDPPDPLGEPGSSDPSQ